MKMTQVTIIPLGNADDREKDIQAVIGEVPYDFNMMPLLPADMDPTDQDVESIIKKALLDRDHEKPTAYGVASAKPENMMGISKGLIFIAH